MEGTMMSKSGYNVWVKAMALGVVCLFLVNTTFQGVSFADVAHAARAALATSTVGDGIRRASELATISEVLATHVRVTAEEADSPDHQLELLRVRVRQMKGVNAVDRSPEGFVFALIDGASITIPFGTGIRSGAIEFVLDRPDSQEELLLQQALAEDESFLRDSLQAIPGVVGVDYGDIRRVTIAWVGGALDSPGEEFKNVYRVTIVPAAGGEQSIVVKVFNPHRSSEGQIQQEVADLEVIEGASEATVARFGLFRQWPVEHDRLVIGGDTTAERTFSVIAEEYLPGTDLRVAGDALGLSASEQTAAEEMAIARLTQLWDLCGRERFLNVVGAPELHAHIQVWRQAGGLEVRVTDPAEDLVALTDGEMFIDRLHASFPHVARERVASLVQEALGDPTSTQEGPRRRARRPDTATVLKGGIPEEAGRGVLGGSVVLREEEAVPERDVPRGRIAQKRAAQQEELAALKETLPGTYFYAEPPASMAIEHFPATSMSAHQRVAQLHDLLFNVDPQSLDHDQSRTLYRHCMQHMARAVDPDHPIDENTVFFVRIGKDLGVGKVDGSVTNLLFNHVFRSLGLNAVMVPLDVDLMGQTAPDIRARYRNLVSLMLDDEKTLGFAAGPMKEETADAIRHWAQGRVNAAGVQSALQGLQRGGVVKTHLVQDGISAVENGELQLIGLMTDGEAWVEALESSPGIDTDAARSLEVMVCGAAGATGEEIVRKLAHRPYAKRVLVVDTPANAGRLRQLAQQLSTATGCDIAAFVSSREEDDIAAARLPGLNELEQHISDARVIVDVTEETDAFATYDMQGVGASHRVYTLMYRPDRYEGLRTAAQQGAPTHNGVNALIADNARQIRGLLLPLLGFSQETADRLTDLAVEPEIREFLEARGYRPHSQTRNIEMEQRLKGKVLEALPGFRGELIPADLVTLLRGMERDSRPTLCCLVRQDEVVVGLLRPDGSLAGNTELKRMSVKQLMEEGASGFFAALLNEVQGPLLSRADAGVGGIAVAVVGRVDSSGILSPTNIPELEGSNVVQLLREAAEVHDVQGLVTVVNDTEAMSEAEPPATSEPTMECIIRPDGLNAMVHQPGRRVNLEIGLADEFKVEGETLEEVATGSSIQGYLAEYDGTTNRQRKKEIEGRLEEALTHLARAIIDSASRFSGLHRLTASGGLIDHPLYERTLRKLLRTQAALQAEEEGAGAQVEVSLTVVRREATDYLKGAQRILHHMDTRALLTSLLSVVADEQEDPRIRRTALGILRDVVRSNEALSALRRTSGSRFADSVRQATLQEAERIVEEKGAHPVNLVREAVFTIGALGNTTHLVQLRILQESYKEYPMLKHAISFANDELMFHLRQPRPTVSLVLRRGMLTASLVEGQSIQGQPASVTVEPSDTKEAVLGKMVQCIVELAEQHNIGFHEIAGVAVAVGAELDEDHQSVARSFYFPALAGENLKHGLEREILENENTKALLPVGEGRAPLRAQHRLPVVLVNDEESLALASARAQERSVYVHMGTETRAWLLEGGRVAKTLPLGQNCSGEYIARHFRRQVHKARGRYRVETLTKREGWTWLDALLAKNPLLANDPDMDYQTRLDSFPDSELVAELGKLLQPPQRNADAEAVIQPLFEEASQTLVAALAAAIRGEGDAVPHVTFGGGVVFHNQFVYHELIQEARHAHAAQLVDGVEFHLKLISREDEEQELPRLLARHVQTELQRTATPAAVEAAASIGMEHGAITVTEQAQGTFTERFARLLNMNRDRLPNTVTTLREGARLRLRQGMRDAADTTPRGQVIHIPQYLATHLVKGDAPLSFLDKVLMRHERVHCSVHPHLPWPRAPDEDFALEVFATVEELAGYLELSPGEKGIIYRWLQSLPLDRTARKRVDAFFELADRFGTPEAMYTRANFTAVALYVAEVHGHAEYLQAGRRRELPNLVREALQRIMPQIEEELPDDIREKLAHVVEINAPPTPAEMRNLPRGVWDHEREEVVGYHEARKRLLDDPGKRAMNERLRSTTTSVKELLAMLGEAATVHDNEVFRFPETTPIGDVPAQAVRANIGATAMVFTAGGLGTRIITELGRIRDSGDHPGTLRSLAETIYEREITDTEFEGFVEFRRQLKALSDEEFDTITKPITPFIGGKSPLQINLERTARLCEKYGVDIPVVIQVSAPTIQGTKMMLAKHNNFGLRNVILVSQDENPMVDQITGRFFNVGGELLTSPDGSAGAVEALANPAEVISSTVDGAAEPSLTAVDWLERFQVANVTVMNGDALTPQDYMEALIGVDRDADGVAIGVDYPPRMKMKSDGTMVHEFTIGTHVVIEDVTTGKTRLENVEYADRTMHKGPEGTLAEAITRHEASGNTVSANIGVYRFSLDVIKDNIGTLRDHVARGKKIETAPLVDGGYRLGVKFEKYLPDYLARCRKIALLKGDMNRWVPLKDVPKAIEAAQNLGVGTDGMVYEESPVVVTAKRQQDTDTQLSQLRQKIRGRAGRQRKLRDDQEWASGQEALVEATWLLATMTELSNSSHPGFKERMAALPAIIEQLNPQASPAEVVAMCIAAMFRDADKFFDGQYVRQEEMPARGSNAYTRYYETVQQPRMAAACIVPLLRELKIHSRIVNRVDALLQHHTSDTSGAGVDFVGDVAAISFFTPDLLVKDFFDAVLSGDEEGFYHQAHRTYSRCSPAARQIIDGRLRAGEVECRKTDEGQDAYEVFARVQRDVAAEAQPAEARDVYVQKGNDALRRVLSRLAGPFVIEDIKNASGELVVPGLLTFADQWLELEGLTKPVGQEHFLTAQEVSAMLEGLHAEDAFSPAVLAEREHTEVVRSEGETREVRATAYYNAIYDKVVKRQGRNLTNSEIKWLFDNLAEGSLARYILVYLKATNANGSEQLWGRIERHAGELELSTEAQAIWRQLTANPGDTDDRIWIDERTQLEIGNPHARPFGDDPQALDFTALQAATDARVAAGVFSVSGIRQIFEASLKDKELPKMFPYRLGIGTEITPAAKVNVATQVKLFVEMLRDPEGFRSAIRLEDMKGRTKRDKLKMLEKTREELVNMLAVTQANKSQREHTRITILLDTRSTGPVIADTDIRMLLAMGVEVDYAFVGSVTEAAVYAQQHDIDAAVYISASHNPEAYNGVKLLLGDGRVMPEEVANAYLAVLKTTLKTPQNTRDVVRMVSGVDSAEVAEVYRGIPAAKELARKKDWEYRDSVITGIPLPDSDGSALQEEQRKEALRRIARAIRTIRERNRKQKLAVIVDPNGGAREDTDYYRDRLGYQVYETNIRKRYDMDHDLCPTTGALLGMEEELEQLRRQAEHDGFTLVGSFHYDTDGDRRNFRPFNPDARRGESKFYLRDDMAHICFAMDVIGYVLSAQRENPNQVVGVAANGPSTALLEELAEKLGFVLIRTQTGEANVVNQMEFLGGKTKENMTWGRVKKSAEVGEREIFIPERLKNDPRFADDSRVNVVCAGEASNGSDFTEALLVRDPLHTIRSMVKFLNPTEGKAMVRMLLTGLGYTAQQQRDMGVNTWWDSPETIMYRLVQVLPESLATDFFTIGGPGQMMNPPSILGLVKDNFDRIFEEEYADSAREQLAALLEGTGIAGVSKEDITYEYVNYEEKAKVGKNPDGTSKRNKKAPIGRKIGDGGYKVQFYITRDGKRVPIGWIWFRDSLTEAGVTRLGASFVFSSALDPDGNLSKEEQGTVVREAYDFLKQTLGDAVKSAVADATKQVLAAQFGKFGPALKPHEEDWDNPEEFYKLKKGAQSYVDEVKEVVQKAIGARTLAGRGTLEKARFAHRIGELDDKAYGDFLARQRRYAQRADAQGIMRIVQRYAEEQQVLAASAVPVGEGPRRLARGAEASYLQRASEIKNEILASGVYSAEEVALLEQDLKDITLAQPSSGRFADVNVDSGVLEINALAFGTEGQPLGPDNELTDAEQHFLRNQIIHELDHLLIAHRYPDFSDAEQEVLVLVREQTRLDYNPTDKDAMVTVSLQGEEAEEANNLIDTLGHSYLGFISSTDEHSILADRVRNAMQYVQNSAIYPNLRGSIDAVNVMREAAVVTAGMTGIAADVAERIGEETRAWGEPARIMCMSHAVANTRAMIKAGTAAEVRGTGRHFWAVGGGYLVDTRPEASGNDTLIQAAGERGFVCIRQDSAFAREHYRGERHDQYTEEAQGYAADDRAFYRAQRELIIARISVLILDEGRPSDDETVVALRRLRVEVDEKLAALSIPAAAGASGMLTVDQATIAMEPVLDQLVARGVDGHQLVVAMSTIADWYRGAIDAEVARTQLELSELDFDEINRMMVARASEIAREALMNLDTHVSGFNARVAAPEVTNFGEGRIGLVLPASLIDEAGIREALQTLATPQATGRSGEAVPRFIVLVETSDPGMRDRIQQLNLPLVEVVFFEAGSAPTLTPEATMEALIRRLMASGVRARNIGFIDAPAPNVETRRQQLEQIIQNISSGRRDICIGIPQAPFPGQALSMHAVLDYVIETIVDDKRQERGSIFGIDLPIEVGSDAMQQRLEEYREASAFLRRA
jgi:phosphomannomutase